MPYLYESHLGGYYDTKEYHEPQTFRQCGDCDWFVGEFETEEEKASPILLIGFWLGARHTAGQMRRHSFLHSIGSIGPTLTDLRQQKMNEKSNS